MEKENLVNQNDLDRFVIMPDPRKIIADIERRDLIKAGQQPPATGLRALTGRFSNLFTRDAGAVQASATVPEARPIQAVQAATPEAAILNPRPN
jgi:hypothetical protein